MKKNSLLAMVVLSLVVAGSIGVYLLRDRTSGSALSASPHADSTGRTTGAPSAGASAPVDVLQHDASSARSSLEEKPSAASARVDSNANREQAAPDSTGAGSGSPSKSKIPTTDELAKKYERMNTEDLKRTFEALVQLLEDQRANMSPDEIEAFSVEVEWVKAKGSQP